MQRHRASPVDPATQMKQPALLAGGGAARIDASVVIKQVVHAAPNSEISGHGEFPKRM
jgi:hypothetical protein